MIHNMIEPRFGLKYKMPHSLVHIVDNTAYTGALPTTIAEEPSLLTTLVVTGTPMGVDNRVVPIARTDILRVAYGLGGVHASAAVNFERFGQTIDYPMSFIEQGAPIRMLRVTPEGATFGVAIVVIQWRREDDPNGTQKLVVRFKQVEWPRELRLDLFKNPEKINDALIKILDANTIRPEDGGQPWKQRAFINYISAGRGAAYNNFAACVNPVVQGRRPRNVRYQFLTIDTLTGAFIERMTGSLVNVNNDHPEAIDTINVQVMNRIEASSILMPFVNESVVHEVYADWLQVFDENLSDDRILHPEDHLVCRRVMNVNIFDIINGNYIWNGNQGDLKLPYFHVDKLRLDVPKLEPTYHVITTESEFDQATPDMLYGRLEKEMYGVVRDGDPYYVGDLFLHTRPGGKDPTLTMAVGINQITGAVTPLRINTLYVLKNAASPNPFGTERESIAIKFAYGEDRELDNAIRTEFVVNGDIVAKVTGNGFKLGVVYNITNPKPGPVGKDIRWYETKELVYQALNLNDIFSIDVGNMIGRWSKNDELADQDNPDAALTRLGATVIDLDNGKVYINGFRYGNADVTPPEDHIDDFNMPNRFAINELIDSKQGASADNYRNTFHAVRIPQEVGLTKDIAGLNFDCIVYPDSAGFDATYTITQFKGVEDIVDGGVGYQIGEVLIAYSDTTATPPEAKMVSKFRVTLVDTDGKILALERENPRAAEAVSMLEADGSMKTHDMVYDDPSTTRVGSGAKIKVKSQKINYPGLPNKIIRYVISGSMGSLFRVTINPIDVPSNYYDANLGINMRSETGGVRIEEGSTGFFDDRNMSDIVFKWRYSELLVRAYKGEIDPRIMSPNRVPAFFLFDGGHNTIIGTTIQPELNYPVSDIVEASTIFSDDEKTMAIERPQILSPILRYEDIDVKQAMYDLMEYRIYQGIPDDFRPIGPGSGLSLFLDTGIHCDYKTAEMAQKSFSRRFNNPNCSWDLGGWVDRTTGKAITFVGHIAHNLFNHIRNTSINKPFVMHSSTILKKNYNVFFPDIDEIDWEKREERYMSGGNIWYPDSNNNLLRRSQRTVFKDAETSDFVQESNMRTLTRMIFMAQTHINSYLLEYSDDGTLKTLEDELNNMFSLWPGRLIERFKIKFERKINIDGGEIVACIFDVWMRGLILRVPIIVNVNRRDS